MAAHGRADPLEPLGHLTEIQANDVAVQQPRFGRLGGMRQWIESIIDTVKGQLSLERHGAHTMDGLITRVAGRLLALATGIWHNLNGGDPGRHLTAYDH